MFIAQLKERSIMYPLNKFVQQNMRFPGDSSRDLFIIRLEVTGGHLSIPKNRAPAELPG